MNLMSNPSVAVPLSNEAGAPSYTGECNAAPEASLERIHVVRISDAPPQSGGLAEFAYRGLERALSLIVLVVGLPIMVIVAILVRLDSPGPALFFMRRVARSILMYGRDLEGRADLVPPPGGYDPDALYYVPEYFTMIKFRTMYQDAGTRFPEHHSREYTKEDFHRQYPKKENDPRVTRIGRILRRVSVDELPNLWSVLIGDMRLVGPRPEHPDVLRYYTAEEMLKFTCKPGITGLAQISGRSLLNWGETLSLDLQYVRTRKVLSDLRIILRTIKEVVVRHGAF